MEDNLQRKVTSYREISRLRSAIYCSCGLFLIILGKHQVIIPVRNAGSLFLKLCTSKTLLRLYNVCLGNFGYHSDTIGWPKLRPSNKIKMPISIMPITSYSVPVIKGRKQRAAGMCVHHFTLSIEANKICRIILIFSPVTRMCIEK